MKPCTRIAMQDLINEVRQHIPFELSLADTCSDNCNGCSVKLLEFLDMELNDWQRRLDQHETPNFGDIKRLANMSKKIYKALQKNCLVG
jgi:hypothetical protein